MMNLDDKIESHSGGFAHATGRRSRSGLAEVADRVALGAKQNMKMSIKAKIKSTEWKLEVGCEISSISKGIKSIIAFSLYVHFTASLQRAFSRSMIR